MALYDGLTVFMGKGKETDVIYLDFCKDFDKIPHNILIAKLDSSGLMGGLFYGQGTGWIAAPKELFQWLSV